MIMSGPDATTPERLRWLRLTNHRLRKFLSAAERHGWTIEPSSVAADCIIVQHPRLRDHFVLYPSGSDSKHTSALRVYDGRDGYEFSPLPTSAAQTFISQNSGVT